MCCVYCLFILLHRDYPIIVMGTTSNPSRVSSKLSSFFLHEFIMQEPSQDERRRMLIGLCYKTSVAKGQTN